MNNTSIFCGTVSSVRFNRNPDGSEKINNDGSMKAYLSVNGKIGTRKATDENGREVHLPLYGYQTFEVYIPKKYVQMTSDQRILHGPIDELYPGLPIAVEYVPVQDSYQKDGVPQYRHYLRYISMELFESAEIRNACRQIRETKIAERRNAKQQSQTQGYNQSQYANQQAPTMTNAQAQYGNHRVSNQPVTQQTAAMANVQPQYGNQQMSNQPAIQQAPVQNTQPQYEMDQYMDEDLPF